MYPHFSDLKQIGRRQGYWADMSGIQAGRKMRTAAAGEEEIPGGRMRRTAASEEERGLWPLAR